MNELLLSNKPAGRSSNFRRLPAQTQHSPAAVNMLSPLSPSPIYLCLIFGAFFGGCGCWTTASTLATASGFSVRSQVVEYDEQDRYKRSVRTQERYSHRELRGIIEVVPNTGKGPPPTLGSSSNVNYYHDVLSDVFLRESNHRCSGSSRSELETELYGVELGASLSHLISVHLEEKTTTIVGDLMSDSSSTGNRHVIGLARLLLLVRQLKLERLSEPDIKTIHNGTRVAIFQSELLDSKEEHDTKTNLQMQLEVVYSESLDRISNEATNDALPMSLQLLMFRKSAAPPPAAVPFARISVQFFQLKPLDPNFIDPNLELQQHRPEYVGPSSFVFPLASGCAGAAVEQRQRAIAAQEAFDDKAGETAPIRRQETGEQLLRMASISGLSFSAKLINTMPHTNSHTDPGLATRRGHEGRGLFFAFDLGAKLLRRDRLLTVDSLRPADRSFHNRNHHHQQYVSTTIYDFERNTKYNIHPTEHIRSSTGNNQPEGPADEWVRACVTSDIAASRASALQRFKFIDFERLQLMGRTWVNTIETMVYEEDNLERLPYWLFPSLPVSVSTSTSAGASNSSAAAAKPPTPIQELSELQDSTARFSMVYYFAADHQFSNDDEGVRRGSSYSAATANLWQLLRIDITGRDPVRNLAPPVFSQRLEISDFLWGQSLHSQPHGSELFALRESCTGGHLQSHTSLALLLEPNDRDNREAALKVTASQLENRAARNEIITEALETEFSLSRTHIDQLRSEAMQAGKKKNSQRRGRWRSPKGRGWSLPSIKLKLRLSDFRLEHIRCQSLARGRFLDLSRVPRFLVATFEDCLWLAHHESRRRLGDGQEDDDEMMFTYSSQSSECLVTKLYRRHQLRDSRLAGAESIEPSSKPFNFHAYEFGEHIMYKVAKSWPPPPLKDDHRGDDYAPALATAQAKVAIQLLSKPLNLVGRQLTLPVLTAGNNTFQVSYLIKHAKLSGSPPASMDNMAPWMPASSASRQIEHLAWRQLSEHDDLVRKVHTEMIGSLGASLRPAAMTGGIMTEPLCKSLCSLDVECKSYSFCERTWWRSSSVGEAECSLSSVDISQPGIEQQLLKLVPFNSPKQRGGHRGESERTILIIVDQSAATANIESPPDRANGEETHHEHSGSRRRQAGLRISDRCTMSSKSYSELFKKSFPLQVDVGRESVLWVSGEDACARECYKRNLDYLKGVIKHKLSLSSVEEDLERLSGVDEADEVSIQRLESVFDWHQQHVKTLCAHYQYSAQDTAGPGNRGNPCILANLADKKPSATENGSMSTVQRQPQVITMNQHKLIYTSLYQQMYGFRLSELHETVAEQEQRQREQQPTGLDNPSFLDNLARLLSAQRLGHNRQIHLGLDDVEYCARACTLQTHGPRPSCASFDFVYQRPNNDSASGSKYCLLNSQSLHDLKRSPQGLADQLLYADENSMGVQYWHFEPRESLIMPTDTADDDYLAELLDTNSSFVRHQLVRLRARMMAARRPGGCQIGALDPPIWLALLFGITSGLFVGVWLGAAWVRHEQETEERTLRNRVIRLVHRLSGVSISNRLLDSEVWM